MSKRLLLVGVEGADWALLQPLIEGGRLPALATLVKEGSSGSLLNGQPLIPSVQLTSLVTGKRAWQHRVCHRVELDASSSRPVPITVAARRSAALWEILANNGKHSVIVGWPATHGSRGERVEIVSNRYSEATTGPGVKPWPTAIPGTYWPRELGARLDALRVSPEDIQSDMVSRFIPDWKTINQKRDRRLGFLRLFLAADLSHHAALVHLLKTTRWDFAAVYYPALAAITSLFLPFAGQRPVRVAEEEFELYRHVLPAAYGLLDHLLRNLVQVAGADTALMLASSCGVDPQRPDRPAQATENESWKSPFGVLVCRGPGIVHSKIIGARILDLAPTILHWFEIPLGDDMEGRVLLEVFDALPEARWVTSWDNAQVHKSEVEVNSASSYEDSATGRLRLEYDWNLARSALDAARYDEALPLLEGLFQAFPERAELGLALFQCQLTLKQLGAATQTIEVLEEVLPPGIELLLCQAELSIAKTMRRETLLLVQEIRTLQPTHPNALRRLGMILWRLRDWPALSDLAQAVLKLNPNEALAWLALAEASLRQGRSAEALDAAQRAIALNYFLPEAHLILSRVLLSEGKWTDAREALQVVLKLQPTHRLAAAYARRNLAKEPFSE